MNENPSSSLSFKFLLSTLPRIVFHPYSLPLIATFERLMWANGRRTRLNVKPFLMGNLPLRKNFSSRLSTYLDSRFVPTRFSFDWIFVQVQSRLDYWQKFIYTNQHHFRWHFRFTIRTIFHYRTISYTNHITFSKPRRGTSRNSRTRVCNTVENFYRMNRSAVRARFATRGGELVTTRIYASTKRGATVNSCSIWHLYSAFTFLNCRYERKQTRKKKTQRNANFPTDSLGKFYRFRHTNQPIQRATFVLVSTTRRRLMRRANRPSITKTVPMFIAQTWNIR